MRSSDLFQWQKASGQTVTVNDMTVTPQSQALIVRWPGGAFVWNRPTAVLVERNGQIERLLVVNVTRAFLLGFVGLSTVITIARMFRRKEQKS